PQLYKQTLMAAGLERVYEFGPLFRAEASDTIRHLSEFYGFDAEMSFINSEEDVMQALEKAISFAFSEVRKRAKEELELLRVEVRVPKTPFPRIRVEDAGTMLEKVNGKLTPEGDMDTENEKLFGKLMSESGQELYFLTRYPTSVRPFYLMRAENPFETRSFDLEFKGMEMASGGQREHRYDALIKSLHEKGLRPEAFNHYLEAFRYGMPPHGGFGLGIDRLVQQMLNLPNVRETILFPRDRSRMAP
ncbi:aspartate--tRNA(Asn) ligase, partial [Candidatus Micrarchaeota archaeon]|nr:aspartate--tRNA(Asn) ligase [Candidatus Micrarchaeota archaeon]